MTFYIFKYDYPYFNTWHVVEADNKEHAIKKILRGTKNIPERKVKFFRSTGWCNYFAVYMYENSRQQNSYWLVSISIRYSRRRLGIGVS